MLEEPVFMEIILFAGSIIRDFYEKIKFKL